MVEYMYKKAWVSLLLCGILFYSCQDDFNVGKYLVDNNIKATMVDTLTVRISNIASDSVVTSNKGVGFAGYYNDPEIGKFRAQSYIEFSRSNSGESDKYAKFDSVMLVLKPNGNYYGDTLQIPSLKISRLASQIEMRDDGYLYSTSTIPLGDMLIDTTFKMKIGNKAKSEVEIKMPDEFGNMLFKGIINGEEYLDSYHYLKTFPGLSIDAGSNSSCVYGFNIQDTTCMIRIYYHVNATFRESKTMEFNANPSKHFYRFVSEKLPDLQYSPKDDPTSSSKTRNMGVIMSGTPLFSRIEFPHLNNFLSLGSTVVIKEATLIIRPVHNTYDTVPLPPILNLFYHDPTSNNRGEALQDNNRTPLTGNLPSDYHLQLTPFYSFNITSFISDQMGKMGYNKWALRVAIPDANAVTTIQRLVFGDQQYEYKGNIANKDNQIQLKVTYVVYD